MNATIGQGGAEGRSRTWHSSGSVATVLVDAGLATLRPDYGAQPSTCFTYRGSVSAVDDCRGDGSAGRDRNLVQWIAGYLALACLAFQVTDALGRIWEWPQAVQQGITVIAALGTFPAGVIAWYHGEKGRQAVCFTEILAVAVLVAGSVIVALRVSL